MGLQGVTGWEWKPIAARDAASCCALCYSSAAVPEGCQSWAFLPWDNSPVPCTIIFGWKTGKGVDDNCPAGKDAPVAFATDSTNKKYDTSYGGAGPCGAAVN